MSSTHPTSPGPDGPTGKQLRYLRQLANDRGQTFTYPQTKQDASREIKRLLATPEQHWVEREVEHDRLHQEVTPQDPVAVREDEIAGHGANAHWTHTHEGRS